MWIDADEARRLAHGIEDGRDLARPTTGPGHESLNRVSAQASTAGAGRHRVPWCTGLLRQPALENGGDIRT